MKKAIFSLVACVALIQASDPAAQNLIKKAQEIPIVSQKNGSFHYNGLLKINRTRIKSDQIIVKVAPNFNIEKSLLMASYKMKGLKIKKIKEFTLRKKGISINNLNKLIIVKISDSSKMEEVIEFLKTLPGVIDAREDKIVTIEMLPNDPNYNEQWDMNKISAPTAWNATQGSKGNNVIVGVIDTGVDYLHPDLINNIWTNEAEANGEPGKDDDGDGYIDDIHGIDVYNGDSDPMDDNSHGTHVAGTIGAMGNDSIGVTGINWHTKIAACKFLNSYGYGYTSGAIECVNYFNTLKQLGNNIVVINNSWGGGSFDEDLYDALQTANDLGIIHVCAAGNSSNDNDSNPAYPASYDLPNIISVAATDENDELAWFSNYGATSVDLAAPGVDILSTVPSKVECNPQKSILGIGFEANTSINNWSFLTINIYYPFEDLPQYHWGRENIGFNSDWSLSDSPNATVPENTFQSALTPTFNLSDYNKSECVGIKYKIKGEGATEYDYLEVFLSGDGGNEWYEYDFKMGTIDEWSDGGKDIIPQELLTEQFRIGFVKLNESNNAESSEGYNIDNVIVYEGHIQRIPQYDSYSGTSMAAPHVTGAIALAASIYKDENSSQLIDRVLKGVDKIDNLAGKVATGGRLNLAKMLQSIPNGGGKILTFNSNWKRFNWQDIDFDTENMTYTPVLIAGPLSYHGPQGAVIRIKDINETGFSLKAQEWNYLDGNHIDENSSIVALQPGRYLMPDGNVWEIGSFNISGTGEFVNVNFEQKFAQTPYLFLTINTYNGVDTVTVRAKDVNESGFKAALFEQQSLMGSGHVAEKVGYLAIYAPDGNGTIGDNEDDNESINYTLVHATVNGDWNEPINPYLFKLQEEQSKDDETDHIYENIDTFLIDGNLIFGQDVSTKGSDPFAIRCYKEEEEE
jgi:subtilisin family serine protease